MERGRTFPRKICNAFNIFKSTARLRSNTGPISSHRNTHLLCLALTVALGPSVRGQDTPAANNSSIAKVASLAPADAGLLIFSDRLLAADTALQDVGVMHLLLQFSGGDPVGWQPLLAETLGIDSSAALQEILKERIAIAAPSWGRLEEGVIIIDDYNRRLLSLVTGRGRVKEREKFNSVNVFETKTGLWVAATRTTLMLAQRGDANSYFRRSVQSLDSPVEPSLAASSAFMARVARLSPTSRVYVYWDDAIVAGEHADSLAEMTGWRSSNSSSMIGFLGRPNLLEITHAGMVSSNGETWYRPRVQFEHVRRLPQTTLASWSTSVDWQSALTDSDLNPTVIELLKSIGVLGAADDENLQEEIIGNLGLRCTVILGADFADKSLTPRLAVMVESVNYRAVVDAIGKRVGQSGMTESQFDVELKGESDSTKIHAIDWPRKSGVAHGHTISVLMSDKLAPSYAGIDGWVIASTSPQHVTEIIQAELGEATRLEDVIPIHAHTRRVRGAVDLVMIQPSLLHGIFQFWEGQIADQAASKPIRSKPNTSKLGIAVQKDLQRGQVVVVDVDSNGIADGLLFANDRIIACEEVLLDLNGPNEHLKMLLSKVKGATRLRVLRDGELVDVSIKFLDRRDAGQPSRIGRILAAVKPFEALIHNSSFALFVKNRAKAGIATTQLVIELDAAFAMERTGESEPTPSNP